NGEDADRRDAAAPPRSAERRVPRRSAAVTRRARLAAAVLGLAGGTVAPFAALTALAVLRALHLLELPRRDLVVAHRDADHGPRYGFDRYERPRTTVAVGEEPRAVVIAVVAPLVEEHVVARVRRVVDRRLRHNELQ